MKLHITVGKNATGEHITLYCGTDGDQAQALVQNPPAGILEVCWFRTPEPWKKRVTAEGAAAREQERQARLARQKAEHEAALKKVEEDKAKAEAAAAAAQSAQEQTGEIQNNPARVSSTAPTKSTSSTPDTTKQKPNPAPPAPVKRTAPAKRARNQS